MANVTIKGGTVVRLIDGYGFAVAETYKKRDGSEGKSSYTVWSDEKVAVGDAVAVSGLLSVKLEEYTTREGERKQTAAAAVNNAEVKVLSQALDADLPF
jgi:hypothetical protein